MIKTTNIEKLEAERRRLDREIRAAKRAAAKKEKEALLSAQHSLGVSLAEAVGADTPEQVEWLREALISGQPSERLRERIAQLAQADAEHREDADGRWSE